jgi:hypothetical protein
MEAITSPLSFKTPNYTMNVVVLCGGSKDGGKNKTHGMQGGIHSTLHTRQSSTQNNKYQASHKHSCFSWWWAHRRPKHVEIDKYKYTKNKLCSKLVLFTRSLTSSVTAMLAKLLQARCWLKKQKEDVHYFSAIWNNMRTPNHWIISSIL